MVQGETCSHDIMCLFVTRGFFECAQFAGVRAHTQNRPIFRYFGHFRFSSVDVAVARLDISFAIHSLMMQSRSLIRSIQWLRSLCAIQNDVHEPNFIRIVQYSNYDDDDDDDDDVVVQDTLHCCRRLLTPSFSPFDRSFGCNWKYVYCFPIWRLLNGVVLTRNMFRFTHSFQWSKRSYYTLERTKQLQLRNCVYVCCVCHIRSRNECAAVYIQGDIRNKIFACNQFFPLRHFFFDSDSFWIFEKWCELELISIFGKAAKNEIQAKFKWRTKKKRRKMNANKFEQESIARLWKLKEGETEWQKRNIENKT